MEDVLDLYSEVPDLRRPVAWFDETPVQLIGETRIPWPAQPGKPARIDYEYGINFNRYFYRYTPPRPLVEVEADIRALQNDIVRMLADVTGADD